jgi:hypothetical protein
VTQVSFRYLGSSRTKWTFCYTSMQCFPFPRDSTCFKLFCVRFAVDLAAFSTWSASFGTTHARVCEPCSCRWNHVTAAQSSKQLETLRTEHEAVRFGVPFGALWLCPLERFANIVTPLYQCNGFATFRPALTVLPCFIMFSMLGLMLPPKPLACAWPLSEEGSSTTSQR